MYIIVGFPQWKKALKTVLIIEVKLRYNRSYPSIGWLVGLPQFLKRTVSLPCSYRRTISTLLSISLMKDNFFVIREAFLDILLFSFSFQDLVKLMSYEKDDTHYTITGKRNIYKIPNTLHNERG